MLIILACGKNTSLTATSESETSFGTDATLDIITWNIENFPKAGGDTVWELSRVLPLINADLIAMQEIIDEDEFSNLANTLPNYVGAIIPDGNKNQKLAFLYNPEVIKNANAYAIYTPYNTYGRPFPRSPYVLEFDYENNHLVVIDNHLKASGDGEIDANNPNDEERRRQEACQLLDAYISEHFNNYKVIVVGDMNDQIQETQATNVFQVFIDKSAYYKFADLPIAQDPTKRDFSYPAYSPPSHLDHILITNELFTTFSHPESLCQTIHAEKYFNGNWQTYDAKITDHRPVGIKLKF